MGCGAAPFRIAKKDKAAPGGKPGEPKWEGISARV